MKNWLFLGVLAVFLTGCASSDELADLKLQSVQDSVTLKKEKEEQLRLAKMQEANAFEQKILAERRTIEESMRLSSDDPKEISLLTLPAGFIRAADVHAMPSDIKEMISSLDPSANTVWANADWRVSVLAGKSVLETSQIIGKTRSEFLRELKSVADLSESYYRSEKKNARTSSKIYDMRSLIVVTVTAVFEADTQTRMNIRYFFYYRPDYRLNLLIDGKKEDVNIVVRDLPPHLSGFQNNLITVFPDGIPFKGEAAS